VVNGSGFLVSKEYFEDCLYLACDKNSFQYFKDVDTSSKENHDCLTNYVWCRFKQMRRSKPGIQSVAWYNEMSQDEHLIAIQIRIAEADLKIDAMTGYRKGKEWREQRQAQLAELIMKQIGDQL